MCIGVGVGGGYFGGVWGGGGLELEGAGGATSEGQARGGGGVTQPQRQAADGTRADRLTD